MGCGASTLGPARTIYTKSLKWHLRGNNGATTISFEPRSKTVLLSSCPDFKSDPSPELKSRLAEPRDQRLAREIIDSFLSNSGSQLVSLLNGETIYSPLHQLEVIVSFFYSSITDAYIGVDSHPPSRFVEVHPFLLESLAAADLLVSPNGSVYDGEHPECHVPRSIRIMTLTRQELEADVARFPYVAADYFSQHEEYSITVLLVEKEAKEQAEKDLLREWTGDLGLWLNTGALLFQNSMAVTNQELRLQLVYPEHHRFTKCIRYVDRLLRESSIVRYANGELSFDPLTELEQDHLVWGLESMFQPRLAESWHEFVAQPKRIKKLGPFIERIVADVGGQKARILDAAAGTGTESVYLAKRGYDVLANEIVPLFVAQAHEAATAADVELSVRRFDWRHLEHLGAADEFDLVLALGNSMSCLASTGDVHAVLSRFAHLLRPGGVLIVDERNYPLMFSKKQQMLSPRFRIPPNVIYCGESIQARPRQYPRQIGADNQLLTLEYHRPGPDSASVGTFKVLPFGDGQLVGLLEDAGFTGVRTYYNLESGHDPRSAEFVTYIATRRPRGTGEPDDDVVVAITDITDSTGVKRRLGADKYAAQWDDHKEHVRSLSRAYQGEVRNDTGDGFVVEFDDEASAVACMGELVKNSGSSELAVRVGLAVGPVVREGES